MQKLLVLLKGFDVFRTEKDVNILLDASIRYVLRTTYISFVSIPFYKSNINMMYVKGELNENIYHRSRIRDAFGRMNHFADERCRCEIYRTIYTSMAFSLVNIYLFPGVQIS